MGSFFDSGPLPDWKNVQRWLGRDLPWKLIENWDKGGDSAWLDKYIKEMMNKAKPGSGARAHAQGIIRTEAVKDAKHVNVTIRLGPEIDRRQLQLFATSDRLKISGLPNNAQQAIRFPCLVFARTGKAIMKQDCLLVRFRRRPMDKEEYELFIQS